MIPHELSNDSYKRLISGSAFSESEPNKMIRLVYWFGMVYGGDDETSAGSVNGDFAKKVAKK